MEIKGNGINPGTDVTVRNTPTEEITPAKTAKKLSSGKLKGKDEVSISEKARHLDQAKSMAESAQDIRDEKVRGIKARVMTGTYYVEASRIADKIIEDIEKG